MGSLVVFDLDGTLVDSRLDLAESANEMLATYGAPPLDWNEVAAMVGDGARELVKRALRAVRASSTTEGPSLTEALDRFLTIYSERLVTHTRPYPGIPEVLARLASRGPIAVLTNKPEGLSRRLLDAFELSDHVSEVIGGDSRFPRKPDPTALIHLMSRFRSEPAQTTMVGDSMVDVETARRAGTRVVVALYGFGSLREPVRLTPDERTVDTPAGILDALTTT
jgi:phosphoglycolate phosphatase